MVQMPLKVRARRRDAGESLFRMPGIIGARRPDTADSRPIRRQDMQRAERLLDLTMYLLARTEPVSAEQVRQEVEGYDPDATDEAFLRKFERDKDDLRNAGIPIVTCATDSVTRAMARSSASAVALRASLILA